MSEEEVYAAFKAVRFADNGGEPFCPHCGVDAVYEYRSKARRLFKCQDCHKQFTLTSCTLFASHKMALRDILVAIAIFVDGANGVSALRLTRDLGCSYKTAFVLLHKLREAMGEMQKDQKLTGIVEVDGVWVGGHIKRKNAADKRIDRRKAPNPKDYTPEDYEKAMKSWGRRRTVVTLRERRRGGRTKSFVFKSEAEAIPAILHHTDPSAIIHVDEGAWWNALHAWRDVNHVDHRRRYADVEKQIHVNSVESFNSRVRRAERGVHHRISGRHLQGYADEFGWREDHRRVDNGRQVAKVLSAVARMPVSREWKGYWQRRATDDPGPARARMALP